MKSLLVILGPTGVGKTALALSVAESLKTEIVNADSRQIYRELPIGTAAPTAEEQSRVRHWFVGNKSICEDYNAGIYEREALQVIRQLHRQHETVVLTGGSMMYIDAVCNGLDELPIVSDTTRTEVRDGYMAGGIEWLQKEAERLDPGYFSIVDRQNPQRLIHAIEVSKEAGVPYSTLRRGRRVEREFRVVKAGLYRERNELYERIDLRVDEMMRLGLAEEARRVYPMRGLNSLNTVGYKEMFMCFDGETSEAEAVSLIKQHSRNYAKRQMTWWKAPRAGSGEKRIVTSGQVETKSDIIWFEASKTKADDILNIL
ncbi:MAG: tRNA (adenosine(37)-N6)-dimethylallyltransferase MiaA [Paludibacteraceae bacterium]|nr:tRNA (adenosine(37)-N6)-dimethylallyltransferase MiaA [Paludibacteraceae bacterium]